jgi:hypothetical protein
MLETLFELLGEAIIEAIAKLFSSIVLNVFELGKELLTTFWRG